MARKNRWWMVMALLAIIVLAGSILWAGRAVRLPEWVKKAGDVIGGREPTPAPPRPESAEPLMTPRHGGEEPLQGFPSVPPTGAPFDAKAFVDQMVASPFPKMAQYRQVQERIDGLLDQVIEETGGGWKEAMQMAKGAASRSPDESENSCRTFVKLYDAGMKKAESMKNDSSVISQEARLDAIPKEEAEKIKRGFYQQWATSRFQYRLCKEIVSK